MTQLASRKCTPCDGKTGKLDAATAAALWSEVPAWVLDERTPVRLRRRFTFRDFVAAMAFVNAMAEIAEQEGHHPNFTVSYNRVDVEVWTHALDGLSENDFILAAKIDALQPGAS